MLPHLYTFLWPALLFIWTVNLGSLHARRLNNEQFRRLDYLISCRNCQKLRLVGMRHCSGCLWSRRGYLHRHKQLTGYAVKAEALIKYRYPHNFAHLFIWAFVLATRNLVLTTFSRSAGQIRNLRPRYCTHLERKLHLADQMDASPAEQP